MDLPLSHQLQELLSSHPDTRLLQSLLSHIKETFEYRLLLLEYTMVEKTVAGRAQGDDVGVDIDTVGKMILGTHRNEMMTFHRLRVLQQRWYGGMERQV